MFESFNDFVNNEARDMNDPVAMRMRAAMNKSAAKSANDKKDGKSDLSPSKAKKLAKLEDKRAELMRDMEQEAEMDGGPVADKYGKALDKIDKQIAKLTGKNYKEFGLMANNNVEADEKLYEATVEMDAMDPDSKDFLKFLKKNKVEIINKEMSGPGGGTPVITMQGKRKDLEKVLADEELGWADPDLAEYIEESVSRVQLKRKYTENYPAITAGKFARIRNKMLEAIGDGKITQEEFDSILKELSSDSTRWSKMNTKYFNVSEDGISLSTFGRRVLKQITINESMDNNTFLFESFEEFVNCLNTNAISEAFKSSKLRNLMNMEHAGTSYGRKIHGLAQAFYNLTKAKLDEIRDEHLIDYPNPEKAAKEFKKKTDVVVFYIVDNEKENPYADRSTYNDLIRPGILGLSQGSEFLGAHYAGRGKKLGKNIAKTDYVTSISKETAIGGNKKYKGYEASGLYNVKRVAELADRAIVVNLYAIKGSDLDARQKVEDRAAAKEGAIAFQSAEEFKKVQRKRYQDILANKASKLPLDKIVENSIETLTKHIADAMKSGAKTKYHEIKIGEDKKGREIKITDASNVMSSLLNAYERYVRYTGEAEKEKDSGYSSGYYAKEAKQQAKNVTNYAKKIKNMDYAW